MNRLRELRLKKGWTQKQLADKLYYRHSIVSNWESGRVTMSESVQEKLCEIFRVTPDYLMGKDADNRRDLAYYLIDKIKLNNKMIDRDEMTDYDKFLIKDNEKLEQIVDILLEV